MKKVCILLTFLLVTKGFAATTHNQGRLYDCAANSLYLFCSLTNNQISYDKSIKLLPMTDRKEGDHVLNIKYWQASSILRVYSSLEFGERNAA